MISAFTQKISELETKVETLKGSLEGLILERGTDNADGRETPASFLKEVDQILFGFQGELKDQHFEVNALSSKVYCQEEELRELRACIQKKINREDELVEMLKKLITQLRDHRKEDVIEQKMNREMTQQAIQNGTEGSSSRKLQLNPEVSEFKPRFLEQSLPGKVTPPHLKQSNGRQFQKAANDRDGQGNIKSHASSGLQVYSKSDNNKFFQQVEGLNRNSQLSIEEPITNENEIDETSFNPEIMQQKLYEKICIIFEAESRLEDALNREAEMAQQLTWAENKIRLLKHDKQRRGETIGKLLHCLDDLKKMGKQDLNTASSEPAILTTTLSTRGMPHDERIQVAINVTESERLHHYRPNKNQLRFSSENIETQGDCDNLPVSRTHCSSVFSTYTCSPKSVTESGMQF